MSQEAKKLVSVFLDQKTIERIDGWADRFGISRSKMAGILIEACIENEGTIIDLASSAPAQKIARLFMEFGRRKQSVEDHRPAGLAAELA